LQIRESPQRHHDKFIEYYDIRDADAALSALNRSDIAGKQIKVESSLPGGTRRYFTSHEIFSVAWFPVMIDSNFERGFVNLIFIM
jgi:RNA recognition motif-containing protein